MTASVGAESEHWCIVLIVVERDGSLVLVAKPTRQAVPCPKCGELSRREHSSYLRRPLDLPWRGHTKTEAALHDSWTERTRQKLSPNSKSRSRTSSSATSPPGDCSFLSDGSCSIAIGTRTPSRRQQRGSRVSW
jgi:hypothetical protein